MECPFKPVTDWYCKLVAINSNHSGKQKCGGASMHSVTYYSQTNPSDIPKDLLGCLYPVL